MLNDFEKAKECAFWYINRRRYTKKELTDRLVKREYDRNLALEVVNYLEEHGYIDDCDYARRYVHDAIIIKKHGAIRVRNELALKGIKGECVERALEQHLDSSADSLADLVASKAHGIDFKDEKERNKLVSFLVRRGYRYSEIFDAIKSYCADKGDI